LKQVVLYGLFEEEIERWHPTSQRFSPYCVSARKGSKIVPYTPKRFAQLIYQTNSVEELRELIFCEEGREDRPAQGSLDDEVFDYEQFYNYMHINISPPRKNKPHTLEFRHHRGTLDPEEIGWWTEFCAALLAFAHFLGQLDLAIEDDNFGDHGNYWASLAAGDLSILDLLDFPAEGRAFFEKKKKEYMSPFYEHYRMIERENIRDVERQLEEEGYYDLTDIGEINPQDWYEEDRNRFRRSIREVEDDKEKIRRADTRRRTVFRTDREDRRMERYRVGRQRQIGRMQAAAEAGSERFVRQEDGSLWDLKPKQSQRVIERANYTTGEVVYGGLKGTWDMSFDPPRFIPRESESREQQRSPPSPRAVMMRTRKRQLREKKKS
jgi:hypothetical protein